jgi:broad specificity phosphatase PhoE
MPKIYLIRHGRAATGWGESVDPGLSPMGQVQAEQASKAMQLRQAMSIISSPMARAQETAAPLATAWQKTPEIDQRFSEIPTPKHIPATRKAWIDDILSRNWDAMAPVLQAWREDLLIAVQSLQQDTVVFTHFIAINAIVGCALNDSRVMVFMPDNASITMVQPHESSIVLLRKGQEMFTLVG